MSDSSIFEDNDYAMPGEKNSCIARKDPSCENYFKRSVLGQVEDFVDSLKKQESLRIRSQASNTFCNIDGDVFVNRMQSILGEGKSLK
jgi:hypothetical protein